MGTSAGSLPGGIEAEYRSGDHCKQQCQHITGKAGLHTHTGVGHQRHQSHAQSNSHHAAKGADEKRFRQEFQQNIPFGSSQSLEDTNLPGTLLNRYKQHVHNTNTANDKDDTGHCHQQHCQGVGGEVAAPFCFPAQ